jgi:hypothetical protein
MIVRKFNETPGASSRGNGVTFAARLQTAKRVGILVCWILVVIVGVHD